MLEVLIILSVISLVLLIKAYRRKDGSPQKAVKIGFSMLKGVTPLLLFAFIISGLLQAAIPPQLIQQWLGDGAGFKGILIGTIGGALIPAGYISFPIISAIHDAGAGIGTVIGFVTGWAMIGVGLIPFELAIMGSRFALLRISLFLIFPFLAGWLAFIIL